MTSWTSQVDDWARDHLGRPVTHLSPRYVGARTREAWRRRLAPPAPWLTHQAVALLSDLLRPRDRGVEFGAGRSTPWIARRTAWLTTVEHSREWADLVRAELAKDGLDNVTLAFVSGVGEQPDPEDYLRPLESIAPGEVDFVLVDGIHRAECAHAAVDLLSSGGLLILDNAERYLPSTSKAPGARGMTFLPEWQDFERKVAVWRRIWTSNGVWDTAIWVKP